MNRRSNNHSGLFLLEIMIAILFFAMVSAVCLRSFAKAHTLSQEASDINQAISHMENVAELLKSADSSVLGDSEKTVQLLNTEYALAEADENQYTLYFDKGWTNCPKDDARYSIEIKDTEKSNDNKNLRNYNISSHTLSDGAAIEEFDLTLYTKN